MAVLVPRFPYKHLGSGEKSRMVKERKSMNFTLGMFIVACVVAGGIDAGVFVSFKISGVDVYCMEAVRQR